MEFYTADICVKLLIAKHNELLCAGLTRYPTRSDFTVDEVCAIKAHLGPWPRALEVAGLKEPRPNSLRRTSAEKRIKAKRCRNATRNKMNKCGDK